MGKHLQKWLLWFWNHLYLQLFILTDPVMYYDHSNIMMTKWCHLPKREFLCIYSNGKHASNSSPKVLNYTKIQFKQKGAKVKTGQEIHTYFTQLQIIVSTIKRSHLALALALILRHIVSISGNTAHTVIPNQRQRLKSSKQSVNVLNCPWVFLQGGTGDNSDRESNSGAQCLLLE